jgi:hypothetical protein
MTSRAPRHRSGLRAYRTRWLVVSLTACSALAGCGNTGHQSIARTDAAPLAALARKIAGEGPCAQRTDIATLRQRAYALVATRSIPSSLADSFVSGVNTLAADAPPCVPAVPPAPLPAKTKKKGPPPKKKHGHGPGDHR